MYFNSNALTLTYYGKEKIKKIMGVTPPWTPLQGRGLPFAAPPLDKFLQATMVEIGTEA